MDGWDSLISTLPGLGTLSGYGLFAFVVVIALRMLAKSDGRYNAEVAEHEATQQALDEERAKRRKAEDDRDEVKAEVRELKVQAAQLEREITILKRVVDP